MMTTSASTGPLPLVHQRHHRAMILPHSTTTMRNGIGPSFHNDDEDEVVLYNNNSIHNSNTTITTNQNNPMKKQSTTSHHLIRSSDNNANTTLRRTTTPTVQDPTSSSIHYDIIPIVTPSTRHNAKTNEEYDDDDYTFRKKKPQQQQQQKVVTVVTPPSTTTSTKPISSNTCRTSNNSTNNQNQHIIVQVDGKKIRASPQMQMQTLNTTTSTTKNDATTTITTSATNSKYRERWLREYIDATSTTMTLMKEVYEDVFTKQTPITTAAAKHLTNSTMNCSTSTKSSTSNSHSSSRSTLVENTKSTTTSCPKNKSHKANQSLGGSVPMKKESSTSFTKTIPKTTPSTTTGGPTPSTSTTRRSTTPTPVTPYITTTMALASRKNMIRSNQSQSQTPTTKHRKKISQEEAVNEQQQQQPRQRRSRGATTTPTTPITNTKTATIRRSSSRTPSRTKHSSSLLRVNDDYYDDDYYNDDETAEISNENGRIITQPQPQPSQLYGTGSQSQYHSEHQSHHHHHLVNKHDFISMVHPKNNNSKNLHVPVVHKNDNFVTTATNRGVVHSTRRVPFGRHHHDFGTQNHSIRQSLDQDDDHDSKPHDEISIGNIVAHRSYEQSATSTLLSHHQLHVQPSSPSSLSELNSDKHDINTEDYYHVVDDDNHRNKNTSKNDFYDYDETISQQEQPPSLNRRHSHNEIVHHHRTFSGESLQVFVDPYEEWIPPITSMDDEYDCDVDGDDDDNNNNNSTYSKNELESSKQHLDYYRDSGGFEQTFHDTIVRVGQNTTDPGVFDHSSYLLAYASTVLAERLVRTPVVASRNHLYHPNGKGVDGDDHYYHEYDPRPTVLSKATTTTGRNNRYELYLPNKPAAEWSLLSLFLQPPTVQQVHVTMDNVPMLLPWFEQLHLPIPIQTCDDLFLEQVVQSKLPLSVKLDEKMQKDGIVTSGMPMNIIDQLLSLTKNNYLNQLDNNSTIAEDDTTYLDYLNHFGNDDIAIGGGNDDNDEETSKKVILNIQKYVYRNTSTKGLNESQRNELQHQALIDLLYIARIACRTNLIQTKQQTLQTLTKSITSHPDIWLFCSAPTPTPTPQKSSNGISGIGDTDGELFIPSSSSYNFCYPCPLFLESGVGSGSVRGSNLRSNGDTPTPAVTKNHDNTHNHRHHEKQRTPIARFEALAGILLDCLRSPNIVSEPSTTENKIEETKGVVSKKKNRDGDHDDDADSNLYVSSSEDDDSSRESDYTPGDKNEDESRNERNEEKDCADNKNVRTKRGSSLLNHLFDSHEAQQLYLALIKYLPDDLMQLYHLDVDSMNCDPNMKTMNTDQVKLTWNSLRDFLQNPMLPFLLRQGITSYENKQLLEKQKQQQNQHQLFQGLRFGGGGGKEENDLQQTIMTKIDEIEFEDKQLNVVSPQDSVQVEANDHVNVDGGIVEAPPLPPTIGSSSNNSADACSRNSCTKSRASHQARNCDISTEPPAEPLTDSHNSSSIRSGLEATTATSTNGSLQKEESSSLQHNTSPPADTADQNEQIKMVDQPLASPTVDTKLKSNECETDDNKSHIIPFVPIPGATDTKDGFQKVADEIQAGISAVWKLSSWILDMEQSDQDDNVTRQGGKANANNSIPNNLFHLSPLKIDNENTRNSSPRKSSKKHTTSSSLNSLEERREWLQRVWYKLNEPSIFGDELTGATMEQQQPKATTDGIKKYGSSNTDHKIEKGSLNSSRDDTLVYSFPTVTSDNCKVMKEIEKKTRRDRKNRQGRKQKQQQQPEKHQVTQRFAC